MATHALPSRSAMLAGLAILLPGVGLLLLAQSAASVAALVMGTPTGGAALALAYRGSLQVINDIAPDDRRAEVVAFLGNSLPVVVAEVAEDHALGPCGPARRADCPS